MTEPWFYATCEACKPEELPSEARRVISLHPSEEEAKRGARPVPILCQKCGKQADWLCI